MPKQRVKPQDDILDVPKNWVNVLVKKHQREASNLADLISQRNAANVDPMSWAKANRWINGSPWSYDSAGPIIDYGKHDKRTKVMKRPYLNQYLLDTCREKSVTKCRQSEFTENQINENLYYSVARGMKVSHVFPTEGIGNAISNEKIKPAIDDSPNISELLRGSGAVQRYAFKSGGFYTIHGALGRAGGRATSRDILVFDEFDFMPSDIFGVFESLLSHSSLAWVRKISTPTVPEVGIDRAVKDGCEYEWFVKCPKCKRIQDLRWPDNLINFFDVVEVSRDDPAYKKRLNEAYIGCRHCGTYIDRNSKFYVNTSRWTAKKPELIKDNASYYLNAMMIPWKTGKELLKKYHELNSYVWQWWNEVFGLAYLKGDNRLLESEVLACQAKWRMTPGRTPNMRNVSIGVDWGEKQSWVVVSASGMDTAHPNKRGVVYVEEINELTLREHGFAGKTTEHVERVKQLCEIFHMDIIINDANGIGIDRNKVLIDKFPGRAWGCFFDTAESGRQLRQSKIMVPEFSNSKRKVTISKVHTLKSLHNEFRGRQIEIPVYEGSAVEPIRKFVRHNMNLAIQPRWSSEYEREYEIAVKMGTEDHYADAHMYSKVGWEKLTGNSDAPIGLIYTPH